MKGSVTSEDEKREMMENAKDKKGGKVLTAVRYLNLQGSLDDYMDFLSENKGFVRFVSSKKTTKNFKL